ncbi:MAG: sulfite exporter TauE/SafE family protein [Alphaproteobacteria bacterium]|nr:sulfite exporter TauE/SafE family protein [Alphaproteobacteria bacterium]
MPTEMSVEVLLMLAAGLLLAGMAAGFLTGLLGIGGGGVLVPVLFETFGALGVDPSIQMHMAVGTSLAAIVPTSIRAFFLHRAKGGVNMAILKRLAPFMVIGVILGTVFAGIVSSDGLKWIWVIFGNLLALKLALGRDDWRIGEAIPKPPVVEIYGLLVGFVAVLMSIAGASFIVAFMTLYNQPLLQAVATSAGLGPLVAIPGVIGFMIAGWGNPLIPPLSVGFVNVLGAALIIPSSILAAPFGVRLAHGLPKRKLELAFAAFMAAVSMRFLLSLLGVV